MPSYEPASRQDALLKADGLIRLARRPEKVYMRERLIAQAEKLIRWASWR